MVSRRALTILEVLVAIGIVAILLALLVPGLLQARRAAAASLCASNARQIAIGWASYAQNHDLFPAADTLPAWRFGGVRFLGKSEFAVLDEGRPLNEHVADASDETGTGRGAAVYECQSDTGVRRFEPSIGRWESVLNGMTCYRAYGTSYRANDFLLDATLTGLDTDRRALKPVEVTAQPSRLIILGDPAWYYATLPASDPQSAYDASWHGVPRAGQVATLDTAVRFLRFDEQEHRGFRVHPRIEAPR